MENEITIRVTEHDYAMKYLQLKTASLLTELQYKVLAEIAKREFIGTEERKEIIEQLSISVFYLNNVLASLKKLGVIKHDAQTKRYWSSINVPKIPGKLTFNFEMR